MTLENLFLTIAMMLSLLPVGVLCLRAWHLDRPGQTMAVFIFVSLCSNVLMMMLMHYLDYNLPVMHVFYVAQVLLLGRLYTLAFADSPPLERAVRVMTLVLLTYTLFNALNIPDWTDGWANMPSRVMTAQCILFVTLALLYFYRLFTASSFVSLERMPLFWFNSGILIYFSLNIYAFIFWKRMLEAGDGQINNFIHLGSSTLTNVFYAIGFLCKPRMLNK